VVGLDIRLGVKISAVKNSKKTVYVQFADAVGEQNMEFDRLIVAVGRVPNSANLGAETVGLKVDARGFVEVDEHCRTSLADVYAIGDVVRGPMLAHKSSEEACRGK